jgi:hypothetical protein
MKRLLILGIVALMATMSGCRTCSSWWNRGADCDTCIGPETVRTYSSGELIAPPAGVQVLPGPA